jgi:hypothetical protein
VKKDLNAKSINDDKRNRGNIINKSLNNSLDILADMEEDVVNDSAFLIIPTVVQ